ncbi:MAG: glycosyltransferase family 4 protein, partial [Myxococcota bacterium]
VLTTNYSPWSPYSGGGQRSTHQIACALAERGHAVTVVYTRAIGETIEPESPVPYAIRWALFFGRSSRRDAPLRSLNALSVAAAVAELHAQHPLDALHGNGEEAALAVWQMGKLGVTTVMTPRYPSYPEPLLRPGGPTPLERAHLALFHGKYLLVGWAARQARWCCPTSESAAQMVERACRVHPEAIRVVPNGINPVFLEHRWAVPAEEDEVQERPVVFFGRLSRDKGADVLLEALALLKERRGAAPKTLIIGRGDEAAALEAQMARLGVRDRVERAPWMTPEQLASVLARSAVVALPSRHESFGNAMAEAMAVGAPLVSCQAGSIPEVVEAGVTGVLVPPGDAPALATALGRLLDDPRWGEQLGRAGRARVKARFSWAGVAEVLEGLYGER